jgi:hypothetical protein
MELPINYEAFRLQGPDEQQEVSTQDSDACNRYAEPEEGQSRVNQEKPCTGAMVWPEYGPATCDTCEEDE